MGVGINCNNVYLIDFDVAKKYRDERGNHIAYEEQVSVLWNIFSHCLIRNLKLILFSTINVFD